MSLSGPLKVVSSKWSMLRRQSSRVQSRLAFVTQDYVVLAALKRSLGDLAAGHQKKLFKVDDHIGVSIAGLTSDARVLTKYMQGQALASRMNMNRAIPVQRLVLDISDRAQTNTQRYGGRPFGVGMLVAGYDVRGCQFMLYCLSV